MEWFEGNPTAAGVIFSLLLALAVLWVAKQNDFFRLPPPSHSVPVSFSQVACFILVVIVGGYLILPFILTVAGILIEGDAYKLKGLTSDVLSWIQIGTLGLVFLLAVAYLFWIRPQTRHFILWGEEKASFKRFFRAIGIGMLGWAISFPCVMFINAAIGALSLLIWGKTDIEQVAVKQLKLTMSQPLLFTAMAFLTVFIVPFIEELIFRGFIQNLMKRYFGRVWAIFVTGAIFACAHFAPSQKESNLQLILSLYVLALFLGFVYERQRTLWASYGLHMTFNAITVIALAIKPD